MLLAVDIGNTRTKFGVFDGERLISKVSIPTVRDISVEGLVKVLNKKLPPGVTQAIVCSVVPESAVAMQRFIELWYVTSPFFVTNGLDFGLRIDHTPLEDAGADRLVNTFSAVEKYGAPCIVCSFGTALTIDFVNAERVLTGGVIAPGMNTLSAALKQNASRLPEVEIETPAAVIQKTTIGSIQSGIVYGYFGLVEGLLARIKSEIGDSPKVIATGGDAEMIAQNITGIDVVENDLLLNGLRVLNGRIRNKPSEPDQSSVPNQS